MKQLALGFAAGLALLLVLSCGRREVPEEQQPLDPATSGSRAVAPVPTPALSDTSHLDAVEGRILELVNRERRRNGLLELQPEPTLVDISRRHNLDMLDRGFFDHRNPDGQSPGDRVAAAHRRLVGVTGENIWTGTGYAAVAAEELALKIVTDWINSPPHRENILRSGFSHLGTGVSESGNEVRATQMFADAWGYIEESVPERVRRGEILNLTLTPAKAGLAAPAGYDLWDPDRQQRFPEAAPVNDGRVDAPPGTYRLRFYFPRGERRYTIYEGPQIEVR